MRKESHKGKRAHETYLEQVQHTWAYELDTWMIEGSGRKGIQRRAPINSIDKKTVGK